MATKARAYIPAGEAAYIEALLRDPDSISRKLGLQRLCHFYRRGAILLNPAPTRVTLRGLLYDESEKVRRWALNSLALVGGSRDAEPILEAIQRYRHQPDVLGAGVAALASITEKDKLTRLLTTRDLPLEGGLLLAVAQRSSAFDEQLRSARLDIEKAAAADLRLGTLLVGLGRAPEHLFSPRHPNRQMIGQLNLHPDPLVAQYSVWATVENPLFRLSDLKLALRDLEAQPANVRGWILRLVASSLATAETNIDILQAGAQDQSPEAREGLAAGLRNIFSTVIEDLVVNWFIREESEPVKQRLLEHMATAGDASPRYSELVLITYRAAATRSLMRARLEAAAQGTHLHLGMKVIAHEAEGEDLFSEAHRDNPVRSSMAAVPPIEGDNRPPSHDANGDGRPIVATSTRDEEPGFPDPGDVRVLIVTALPIEAAAVLATLQRYKAAGVEDDPNIYHLGVYGGARQRAVLLCRSGMGKTNASTTAANALRSFRQVEHVIMVGIAGGCPNPARPEEHVRLGDIVISGQNGVIEYDFVKQTDGGRQIRAWPQRPSQRLLGAAGELATMAILGQRPWEAIIAAGLGASEDFVRPPPETDVLHDASGVVVPHPEDGRRRPDFPQVHSGVIGTSDTLQKDPAARDELRDQFGVRAIEMEGSGMQNAAWAAGKDVFVVRGVCDYCDAFKNDAWHGCAALAAAAYTKSLVGVMPEEWFPAPRA